MAFSLEHSNIIAFTPRNILTIAVMVTIGWFTLHLLGVTVGTIANILSGVGGNVDGSASIDSQSAQASAGVGISY